MLDTMRSRCYGLRPDRRSGGSGIDLPGDSRYASGIRVFDADLKAHRHRGRDGTVNLDPHVEIDSLTGIPDRAGLCDIIGITQQPVGVC